MEKCVKGIMIEQNITKEDNIECYDRIRDVYGSIYSKLKEHFPYSLVENGTISELRKRQILDKVTNYVGTNMRNSILCDDSYLEDGIDFMYELIELDREPVSNDVYFVEVHCVDDKVLRDKLSSISKDYTITTDPLQLTIKRLCKDSYKNGNTDPKSMSDDVYDNIYTYIHESEAIDYEVEDYFMTNSI